MNRNIKDREAYTVITNAFKRQRSGATVVDIAAKTALSLTKVKELAPAVADEYAGRLQVTESGEILYSFPHGFKSKYRGPSVFLWKLFEKFGKGLKIFASLLFKVWIMVMLIGYFALFMLLALLALVVSIGGSSNSNSRSDHGGGLFLAHGIFDLIIRIWFYSEIAKSFNPNYRGRQARPAGRPLHKAIFSFVFGDGNPNADWETRSRRAVIAYIQANKGVISLPEYVMLTGLPLSDAEGAITAFCAEFNGSPEATDYGTVVYRFDDLLLRADTRDHSFVGSSPLKRVEVFSSNKKSMNVWLSVINGVNVLFGGYFLFNAIKYGEIVARELPRGGRTVLQLISTVTDSAPSFLYGMTYYLLEKFSMNPLPIITIGLGMSPLVFSVLFWLVPAIRSSLVKKNNETIKFENLRKLGYAHVWAFPRGVRTVDVGHSDRALVDDVCAPSNLPRAQDSIVKEIGVYSSPEVRTDSTGGVVYDFSELEREKSAIEAYRATVRPSEIGEVVFDSESEE
ncbi:MAG: hypothetical protein LBE74_10290 [Treponema sp.]|jgi:hypothetical protein|nr:hypothetical protein [Treponema sp.]